MLAGDVMQFLGIVVVIVEFSLSITPLGEPPTLGAEALTIEFAAPGDERESSVFCGCRRVFQHRPQARSGHGMRKLQPTDARNLLLGICFWREAPETAVGPDRRAGKWGLRNKGDGRS